CPVVRSRIVAIFVQKTVVTRCESVMHDNLHTLLCQCAKLIEKTERVYELARQFVSTTGGLSSFIQPHRLAGKIVITYSRIKIFNFVSSVKPFGGHRLLNREIPHASVRYGSIKVIGEGVENGRRHLHQVSSFEQLHPHTCRRAAWHQ